MVLNRARCKQMQNQWQKVAACIAIRFISGPQLMHRRRASNAAVVDTIDPDWHLSSHKCQLDSAWVTWEIRLHDFRFDDLQIIRIQSLFLGVQSIGGVF